MATSTGYISFHNTDASACCAKCAADARCSGFEVVTGGGDLASGSSADCYLKDWHTAGTGGSPSGPRPVQGSYNNRILGYNTRSASCDASKFITSGNINGFDYATFHNSGPADCCAKCAADPRCSGFGVVTGGGDLASGSSADCYLKDWHATTSPTPLAKPVQSTYPDRVLGYTLLNTVLYRSATQKSARFRRRSRLCKCVTCTNWHFDGLSRGYRPAYVMCQS